MQPVRPTLNPTNYPEESSMRMSQLVSLFAAGLCAVSALALAADMTVVKESIAGGDGNAVKFQGNPLPLSGKMLKVGDPSRRRQSVQRGCPHGYRRGGAEDRFSSTRTVWV